MQPADSLVVVGVVGGVGDAGEGVTSSWKTRATTEGGKSGGGHFRD